MKKKTLIYKGKAKDLYEGPQPGTVIQYFKDDATAGNGQRHEIIEGKGIINNRISEFIMLQLENIGIPTHFIRRINMREQLVREAEMLPLEVVIRNVAAGSICKRLGIERGLRFDSPLVEFYYKNDELGDPIVSPEHIINLGWADSFDLEEIALMTRRINDFLMGLFAGVGFILVDFKLEFGVYMPVSDEEDGFPELILADEISPDNCRLWDMKTKKSFDKDVFRNSEGSLAEVYAEVAKRLGVLQNSGEPQEFPDLSAINVHELVQKRAALQNNKPKRTAPDRHKPAHRKTDDKVDESEEGDAEE